MYASFQGYTKTIRVLLAANADPNITNEVKLHYSHCLYNSNLMHYVTGWLYCPPCGCHGGRSRSNQPVSEARSSSGHQRRGSQLTIYYGV